MASADVTSHGKQTMLLLSANAEESLSSLLLQTYIRWPRAARSSASAWPMPELAPVMTMTCVSGNDDGAWSASERPELFQRCWMRTSQNIRASVIATLVMFRNVTALDSPDVRESMARGISI